MNDIKTRKFKCTGCGEDRPCYLETNKESSIFDLYTEDKLTCVLDVTNRTGFNWEEVEANGATTGEKQCNLPVVSGSALEADYWSERCKLAEAIEEENPCDPDVTSDQIKAWSNYHNFIKTKGQRHYR